MAAKEANMRRTTAVLHAQHALPLPRGWLIMGFALTSWAVFALLWAGMSQLFQVVSSVF